MKKVVVIRRLLKITNAANLRTNNVGPSKATLKEKSLMSGSSKSKKSPYGKSFLTAL